MHSHPHSPHRTHPRPHARASFFWGDFQLMGQWSTMWLLKLIDIGGSLIFTLIYFLEIPAIERWKTNPHNPWPWKSEDPAVRAKYAELTSKVFFVLFLFLFLLVIEWQHISTERKPPYWFFVGIWECCLLKNSSPLLSSPRPLP